MEISKRNIGLDFLKLISCIAVVGLHVFSYDYNNVFIDYCHYIFGYAVPVFFMVNGYLILNKKEVTYKYVIRKILLIAKVVVLWCVLFFLINLAVKQTFINPFKLIAKSLLQRGGLWQFWFLGAMMITYLFAPLIHKFLNNSKNGYKIIICILLSVNLANLALNLIFNKNVFDPYGSTIRIWNWLFFFVIGGYMKKFTSELCKKTNEKIHLIITLIFFTGFPVYQMFIGEIWNYGSYYIDPVAVANVILIFTFAMRIKFSEKISGKIVFLSSLGMGCYIIHPIINDNFNKINDYTITALPFIVFPLLILVSFAIAYVLKKIPIADNLVDL